MAVTDLREGGSLEELATLPDQGVTSYKLFMAYKGALMVDDETLFRTMQVASDTGALVMVHAENGDAIDVLVKDALAAGHTEPKYHALTRPPETEGEATNRAIQLARVADCNLYVVHVSCKESIDPIAIAREKGWKTWGETCTQYFFVDYSFLERPDFEGAKYVYTPPPRAKENQEHLWTAVRSDILSVISTDHCAFLWDGQKTLGRDDFSKIPNGGPGLEHRLQMIHEFGVRGGRITLNRMVELLATNPAKLFGLYPRKGTIAVGSDADVVVFDPEKRLTLSATAHHSRIDYNLYEGTEVTGSPEVVLRRGEVLVEGDELVASAGLRAVRQARAVRRGAEGDGSGPVALSGHVLGSDPGHVRGRPRTCPPGAYAAAGRPGASPDRRAGNALRTRPLGTRPGSDPQHGPNGHVAEPRRATSGVRPLTWLRGTRPRGLRALLSSGRRRRTPPGGRCGRARLAPRARSSRAARRRSRPGRP